MKQIIVGASAFILAACGGSGNSSGTNGSTAVDNGRVFGDFVRKSTLCDASVPDTAAKVIVHRKDGSILATYQPNAAGHLDIPWSTDAAHLTMVSRPSSGIQLYTELELSAGDLGKIETFDEQLNSSCNCKSVTVYPFDLQSAYPNYTIRLSGNNTNNSYTYEFCQDKQGHYNLADLLLEPQIDGDPAYGALIDGDLLSTDLNLTPEMVSSESRIQIISAPLMVNG